MQDQTASTPTTADPKRRFLCRHVSTDGHRCGSPSLRGEHLCYYHTRSRRQGPCAGRAGTFILPRIDDRPAVQLALYDVLSRMAAGDIDLKRGTGLLYGLQIASSNLPPHSKEAAANAQTQPVVEDITDDYNLGDLAPIALYPEPQPAPTAAPSPEAVILSAAKDPCISPEPTPTTAPSPGAVILSQQKDPRSTTAPLPAQRSASEIGPDFSPGITAQKSTPDLAPGTGSATTEPPTPTLNSSLLSPTSAEILRRRIPGYVHNSPDKDLPLYPVIRPEIIFRPTPEELAGQAAPASSSIPRYTTNTHDSYPRMAP